MIEHSVNRGFTLRIAAAWQPPTGAASDKTSDYAGGLVVRDRRSGKDHILPNEKSAYSSDVGGFAYDLDVAFTAAIPAGRHPYIASANRGTEKYEVQSGYLTIRDIGEMSANEKTLCGLRDLMHARATDGDVDLISLSLPGGMNYSKMSGTELAKLVTYYEAKVAQEKRGSDRGYLRW